MISIISGTNRLNNKSLEVAKAYLEICKELNAKAKILNLQTLPADFIFSNNYRNENADFNAIMEEYVAKADKFIFVVPEYNGSFPGLLKAFLDCIPTELWKGKKACLLGLSAGKAGNARGLDHLMAVLHYLQMEVYSKKPKLSSFHTLLNEDGELKDNATLDQMHEQVQNFLDF